MQAEPPAPAALGFRMPAEWEPHEATWLAWPHERSDWPGKFASIPWVYAEMIRHLARAERVRVLVNDAGAEQKARRILVKAHVELAAVEFFHVPTDRSWTRDFCPIFVRNASGERGILNWRFNAWAKYRNAKRDDAVTELLAPKLGFQMWTPTCKEKRIVLEGGSIDVNGSGSVLTTEECLLSDVQARNPGLTRHDIERAFEDFLGARNTLWLRNGIAGDDTHGHIDDLARFVNPTTVVVATEEDRGDETYDALCENLALLRQMRDQDGCPLRVEALPMPEPVFFNRQRLPATYLNFYIANSAVLVPTFNDANDCLALNKLQHVFPDREVIGIASRDLVLGLGTLHCATQQQPA